MAKFKSLNIGDTVRVVSLADTDDRCGLNGTVEASVGSTLSITCLARHQRTGVGRVELSNGWWYSPKGLEVLAEPTEPTVTAEPTGDEQGGLVTPETPVGTTVVYIGGDEGTYAPVGVPLELARHDGDSRPRVEVIGSSDPSDTYYPDYEYLRVHTGGSIPTTTTAPTPEPVVNTTEDFKYTRVRVKDTGAEGVVVGRSKRGNVAVLHDETSYNYHAGTHCAKDFVGVPNRIRYYPSEALEIIGGVQ